MNRQPHLQEKGTHADAKPFLALGESQHSAHTTSVIKPEWNNTSLLGDDLVASVRALKASVEGNILIYGSASVCHTLISAGLIDEFALMVYPVVLGRGIRLFPEGVKVDLKPIENRPLGGGIALLRWQSAETG